MRKGVPAEAFTYMVECRDGSYYCGWTNALWQRIAHHNNGTGARYTASRRPVHLIYVERYLSNRVAMSREWHIKHLTRNKKSRLIQINRAVIVALGEKTDSREGLIPEAGILPDSIMLPENFGLICRPTWESGILWFAENAGGERLGIAGGFALSEHAVLYGAEKTVSYLASSWEEFMRMPETYLENRWLLSESE